MASVGSQSYPHSSTAAARRGIGLRDMLLCWLVATATAASSAFAADDGMVERGRAVFDRHCSACHGDGDGDHSDGAAALPGTLALSLKYQDAVPALLEQRTDLDAESIKSFVRNGVGSMPPFRPTEVTDEDIEAIAAFLARDRE